MGLFSSYAHPSVTLATTGVMGLFYVLLTAWVIRWRFLERVAIGLPSNTESNLLRTARVHGNFSEYVPFSLFMMYLLESSGADRRGVATVGALLVVGRALHWKGLLVRRVPNVWRATGVFFTLFPLGGMGVWMLCRELSR